MFPEGTHDLFPIACRVVNTDQWLVTHFSASWKVSEVKHYILSKVSSPTQTQDFHFHYPPRHRPVSPITFASVSEDHTLDSDDDADDVFAFEPPRRAAVPAPATPVTPASPGTAHAVQQYPLLAFSTGQLLEDDYSLAWYHLRPHELLELHPAGAVVRLPREVMAEYVQPYFEARVRALRIVWSDKDNAKAEKERDAARAGKVKADAAAKGKGKVADAGEPPGPDRSALPVIRRKRKTRLEWKERWLVVSQGMLYLFKERTDTTPAHLSSLSSLCALRGAEDLFRGTSGPRPSPHVICAKFRSADSPLSATAGTESAPDPVLSPATEAWVDPWGGGSIPREGEDPGEASGSGRGWMRRGSKEKEEAKSRKGSGGSPGIFGEGKKGKEKEGSTPRSEGSRTSGCDLKAEAGEGIWLILDMMDENLYDSLLRVLHRTSSDIATTFVPPVSKPQTPPTPPDSPLLASSFNALPSLPYPEWRIDIARKAQKAGMGDVGRAMSWIMWGDERETRRRSNSTVTTLTTGKPKRGAFDITDYTRGEFGTDDSSDDDLDSEMEWEGWAADLQHTRRPAGAAPVSPPPDTHGEIDGVRRRLAASALSSPPSAESLWRAARDAAPSPLSLACALPPASPPPAFAPELDIAGGSLLAAPAALPVPLSGMTTSTVSAGGVVRARSLRAVNEDGRGRGVPVAMAVLAEDADADAPASASAREREKGKRPRSGLGSAGSRRVSLVPPPGEEESQPQQGKRGLARAVRRTKAFSPDRLVKGLDSALEFVEGRYGVGSSSTLG